MGYTTEFEGQVDIYPPLNLQEYSFLMDLSTSRRMDRTKGPLYVGGKNYSDQLGGQDVLNNNRPHPDQPGLWCKWEPTNDGLHIHWNGAEKFYDSVAWMKYIITKLLAPEAEGYVAQHASEDERLQYFTCNHIVNGEIRAEGEDRDDIWKLVVEDNVVYVQALMIKREELWGGRVPA